MSEKYTFDENTFNPIFDEYAPIIYKYVERFCHDPEEAGSIFGNVFVQFLEKLTLRKGPPSDPRIYLYRIAYNSIVKYLHANQQKSPSFIKSLPLREEEQAIKEASLAALNKEIQQQVENKVCQV